MRLMLFLAALHFQLCLLANNALLVKAENAMAKQEHSLALTHYHVLDSLGYGNASMFCNMAIAAASEGRQAHAIWYIEKARKYEPTSNKIKQLITDLNLRDKAGDAPFSDPNSTKLMNGLSGFLLADTWAGIALFLMVVFLFFCWRMTRSTSRPIHMTQMVMSRKGAVLATIAISCSFSFIAANYRHNQVFHNRARIITETGCKLKAGPDMLSPDIQDMEAGSKVYFHDALNGWWEVTTNQGDKGWISSSYAKKV